MNKQIPNILTIIRIIASPVTIIVLFIDWPYHYLTATIIFVLIILTDAADGFFARKYNLISKFGTLWDPIADKLVVNMTLIALLCLGVFPLWLILINYARELIINAFRGVANNQKIFIGVIIAGKLKTVCQALAIIGGLLYLFFQHKNFAHWLYQGANGLLIFSLIVSLFGIIIMFKKNWKTAVRLMLVK